VIQQRVFLDANILFSIAYGSAGLERLCRLAKKRNFELIASQYVIEEAVRNLDRQDQRDALYRFLAEVRVVPEADPTIPCPVVLPEKDRPVFLAALSSKANYLLTGDITHFGQFFGKTIQGVRICAPRDLFDVISRRKP
jgi:predicted nucleic acid-binding protein